MLIASLLFFKLKTMEYEKTIPTRQFCDICGHVDRVMFWIPDELWAEVVPSHHQTSRVCLNCFTERADEKMVEWDKVIRLCPVSLFTQLSIQNRVARGEYSNEVHEFHVPAVA